MTIINNSIFRACSRRLAAYEYMTRDYVSVQEGASVREAMRSLVKQAGERENVSTIYVVDAAGVLTAPSSSRGSSAPARGTRSPPSRSATSPP